MYDTSLSKIHQGYGAMQKENKRCIPKEGMPHVSACQKKRENKRCIPKEGMPHAQACQKKIAPYPKRKKKGEIVHTTESIHHPPKISTHLHILIKVYDLFLLWIWSLTQQNMRSRYAFKILHTYSSTKISHQRQVEEERHNKSLGKELYTLSDPRDHPTNFINFF